jgi:hypothetical protein
MHGLKIPPGDIKIFDQSINGQRSILIQPDMDMTSYMANLPGRPIEQALVYFPIWIIEYEYKGRPYNVVIDGSTGETFATDYPRRAETPFIAVAVVGFIIFLLAGIVIPFNAWIGIVAVLATLPAIFGAGYYVATKC